MLIPLALADSISIHAAREGGDTSTQAQQTSPQEFQSTPPVKAATAARMPKVRNDEISIHAAREGGDHSSHLVCLLRIRISIHAAREGGDGKVFGLRICIGDFNPRRP